jgi:hypothetical protein
MGEWIHGLLLELSVTAGIESGMAQPVAKPRADKTQPASTSRRRPTKTSVRKPTLSPGARRCRAKFLQYFPQGFHDPDYVGSERAYKWDAHQRWEEALNQEAFRKLLSAREYQQIAARAVSIESRTNLLFSFEKMALRDAVKSSVGAKEFAHGLYDFLHGVGDLETKFNHWRDVVGELPRRQTRVLTWPVLTVMGFLAQPRVHMYLKPTVTRRAAEAYGYDFIYRSRPTWETYRSLLGFARTVARDMRDLRPRDMIDLQSFIWVQGSDEYPD